MSINMNDLTDEEKYFLLELSYIDLSNRPPISSSNKPSIRDALVYIATHDTKKDNIEKINLLINKYDTMIIENKTALSDVRLIGYENHNPTGNPTVNDKSGFVGYALEDSNGNRGVLFRGSELGTSLDLDEWIDWSDNADSSLTGTSKQVEQANAFFDKYKVEGGTNSIYGHSKGNNLGAEVFLNNLDMDIYAYSVNGQPVYWNDLTEKQREALRGDRYTFIVHNRDFISDIGHVEYVDRVVNLKGISWKSFNPMYPHSLESVEFDLNGNFKSSRKPNLTDRFLSIGFEALINTINNKGSIYYFLTEVVKATYVAVSQEAYEAVKFIKDKCIELASKLENWTRETIDRVNVWFDQVAQKAKLYFQEMKDWFFGRDTSTPLEPHISINIGRLQEYAQRLMSIRRQVSEVNERIEDLYFRVGFSGIHNVFRADRLTENHYKINQCIEYLQTSAEKLEQAEMGLIRKANTM
ncbi:hypothetical protein NV379_13415 [Paenibacillus sp. N1-5-1-14]|uniref:hypothetical protein n=1 Tax=Paenibacillus radicibacter TaxID=2972488 RepID=UPI00215976FE|nr:hypothetical protein [Paenibacillus radicibacter]MCR8643650.1 hypothetical protein [Paenibacillus radicibacter]